MDTSEYRFRWDWRPTFRDQAAYGRYGDSVACAQAWGYCGA
jgi:hypothetical protein